MNDEKLRILITQASKGCTESWEMLYREKYQAVFAFSLSIIADVQHANDVTHNTFIAVRNIKQDRLPTKNALAWLFGIARNQALMILRQSKRETGSIDNHLGDGGSIESQVENGCLLSAAIKVLKENERQVIFLKSVSGYKHREISDLLGIPPGTVRSLYKIALHKLRKEIEK